MPDPSRLRDGPSQADTGVSVTGPVCPSHRRTHLAGRHGEAAALAACYRSCLELARAHGIDSVDFPSISTGVYGYPMAQAASVALKVIMEDLRTHDHPCRVRMVCHTEDAASIYRQTYNLWYAETKEDRL